MEHAPHILQPFLAPQCMWSCFLHAHVAQLRNYAPVAVGAYMGYRIAADLRLLVRAHTWLLVGNTGSTSADLVAVGSNADLVRFAYY